MKYKKMLTLVGITLAVLLGLHLFASRTLTFEEEVIVDRSAGEVWEVLGNQFTSPHLWATNFLTSKPGGDPKLPGLSYRHRATVTASGENWQELDSFDPSNYCLSYHISKGAPAIAAYASGRWKLTDLSEKSTKLNVEFVLQTKGLVGFLMSPIIGKKIGNASTKIVEEFQYYIENERAHPRKLAAQQANMSK